MPSIAVKVRGPPRASFARARGTSRVTSRRSWLLGKPAAGSSTNRSYHGRVRMQDDTWDWTSVGIALSIPLFNHDCRERDHSQQSPIPELSATGGNYDRVAQNDRASQLFRTLHIYVSHISRLMTSSVMRSSARNAVQLETEDPGVKFSRRRPLLHRRRQIAT